MIKVFKMLDAIFKDYIMKFLDDLLYVEKNLKDISKIKGLEVILHENGFDIHKNKRSFMAKRKKRTFVPCEYESLKTDIISQNLNYKIFISSNYNNYFDIYDYSTEISEEDLFFLSLTYNKEKFENYYFNKIVTDITGYDWAIPANFFDEVICLKRLVGGKNG